MNPEERQKRIALRNRNMFIAALCALILAIVFVIILSVKNTAIKGDLKTLEAEKEMQRADFQAEVDSLIKVHNELKESYGELSLELAE